MTPTIVARAQARLRNLRASRAADAGCFVVQPRFLLKHGQPTCFCLSSCGPRSSSRKASKCPLEDWTRPNHCSPLSKQGCASSFFVPAMSWDCETGALKHDGQETVFQNVAVSQLEYPVSWQAVLRSLSLTLQSHFPEPELPFQSWLP